MPGTLCYIPSKVEQARPVTRQRLSPGEPLLTHPQMTHAHLWWAMWEAAGGDDDSKQWVAQGPGTSWMPFFISVLLDLELLNLVLMVSSVLEVSR